MAEKRFRLILQKTALMVALLAGAIFAGFPVLWMVSSSLKRNTDIFAYPPKLIEEVITIQAYVEILTDPEKLRFFGNSYLVSCAVTVLTLAVSILAAYSFSRYEYRGKKALNVVIISIQAIPPITLLVPYFGLIVTLGINKINISSDIKAAYHDKMREVLKDESLREPGDIQKPCMEAMKQVAFHKIRLFQSDGKADLY